MKFTHLVVNGCSYAFSQNLDHKHKWSVKTSNFLNLSLVLLAEPGASNERVKRTTLEYLLENKHLPATQFNPLCIICFTQSERREEWHHLDNNPKTVFVPYDYDEYRKYQNTNNDQGSVAWSYALLKNLSNDTTIWNIRKKYLMWLELTYCVKQLGYECLTTDYFPETDSKIQSKFCNEHSLLYNEVESDQNRLTDFEKLTSGLPPLECGHDGVEAQDVICEYLQSEIINRYDLA